MPASPPAEGPDAIRRTWAGVLGAFPDDSPTIERVLAEGDTVVVQFSSSSTNSGPIVLPTGETLPATG